MSVAVVGKFHNKSRNERKVMEDKSDQELAKRQSMECQKITNKPCENWFHSSVKLNSFDALK
jgi:hypothetical protein